MAALRLSLTRPLSSTPDAFDPNRIADFHDVLRFVDAEVGELGNVTKSILSGKTSTEGTEFLG